MILHGINYAFARIKSVRRQHNKKNSVVVYIAHFRILFTRKAGKGMRVVVTGGGWAGISAAAEAAKVGSEVILLERTDLILGTGLVGGIMSNNGRLTAAEEMTAMGGGEIFGIIEKNIRHKNLSFPNHEHADLYDIIKVPDAIFTYLSELGVQLKFQARINKVDVENGKIQRIYDQKGNAYEGNVFLDCTGTAGPMGNCSKFGNGCAMCILRCPSFGGRISLTGLAGIKEIQGRKEDGTLGAMSGSCKLNKESLSQEIREELEEKGVVMIPVPKDLIKEHLGMKACQQYASREFAENLILLDTGHAKLMTPYFPIDQLKKIPGFQLARYEDPYGGGIGNSMRYFEMAPRDDTLRVRGLENLFCAGEKAGLLVGHTEAIVTGILAGYNAVRYGNQMEGLIIDRTLAIGEAIGFVRESMETEIGLQKKYTFSGSVLLEQLKEKKLYTIDKTIIKNRVEKAGLTKVFESLQS